MSDVPSSKSIPPDSSPSGPCNGDETLPIIAPARLPTRMAIGGDARHDPRAPALADDITRLVQAFLQQPASVGHKEVRDHEPGASAVHDDLQVRLHGPGWQGTDQQNLIEQIKVLIRTRLAKE